MTKYKRKELNKHLHQLLRLRDGKKCLRCKKTERLQLSHIYPKGKYRKIEFDSDNVILLCVGCHLYWWHKNPIEAHDWLKSTIPEKRLSRLKLRALYVDKSKMDYNLIKIGLQKEIERLQAEEQKKMPV